MNTVVLSDEPHIILRLGEPAILRWQDVAGYFELEAGSLTADSLVLNDLHRFWTGRGMNWTYGEHNERYTLTIEMERKKDIVNLRLDYHHMVDHIGIDRSVAVTAPKTGME